MTKTDSIQVAFAIDQGLIEPLCVTLHSLLRHRSGPTEVLLLATDLSEVQLKPIRQTVALFPLASLTVQPFELEDADLASMSSGHLTATSLARIFLPDYVAGRVLYLDADILVLGDLGPLFHSDMAGRSLAAARDLPQQVHYDILARSAKGDAVLPRDLRRAEKGVHGFRTFLPWGNPEHYVNTGVLLMDCAAMRQDAERYVRLRDVAQAAQYPLLDQDHINRTYGEDIIKLPLRWNRLAGNVSEGMYRRYLAAHDLPDEAAVYHYAGPRKPWKTWWRWRRSAAPAKMLRWRWERHLWRRNLRKGAAHDLAEPRFANG
ncbi:glycosyltransferase family 8 protein [Thalassovita sp.]|uniref:glycosyltransferase family 8 protein n=1 Tax=Thalassovita sp. TaxID=1979401 RepID=UPI002AAF51A3|nr:glycosyltransferase family 8 protein [Thalassovita sp.]